MLTEPVVRVTLRISTTVSLANRVQEELQEVVQSNTTGLASLLRAKGHDVTAIYINSITSSLVRQVAIVAADEWADLIMSICWSRQAVLS